MRLSVCSVTSGHVADPQAIQTAWHDKGPSVGKRTLPLAVVESGAAATSRHLTGTERAPSDGAAQVSSLACALCHVAYPLGGRR